MIAIIDYDIGNLGSVLKAFKYLNIDAVLTKDVDEIKKADGLVLPGVGAFGEGMRNLRCLGLEKIIKEELAKGKPFLGICLGMQLLFESSEEANQEKGLALIPGAVRKFDPVAVGKIPQIGWNQLELVKDDPLFGELDGEDYYFVHSYYVSPESEEYVLAKTVYGKTVFVSVVKKDNIWGMQCHPEKSSKVGLQTLKNFGEVVLQWK
ncbi:imidazole glycerol phosphate synthase subunit HisH [Natronospora cellulosivora (SeqCode)]